VIRALAALTASPAAIPIPARRSRACLQTKKKQLGHLLAGV